MDVTVVLTRLQLAALAVLALAGGAVVAMLAFAAKGGVTMASALALGSRFDPLPINWVGSLPVPG